MSVPDFYSVINPKKKESEEVPDFYSIIEPEEESEDTPDFYSLMEPKEAETKESPDFYSLMEPEKDEGKIKEPGLFERVLKRTGEAAAYQTQLPQASGGAITPRAGKIILEESPKALEGLTAGFYKAPEFEIPEAEQEARAVMGESLRLFGEANLIYGASKLLKTLGIDPTTWYGRVAVGAGLGGGLSTAKQAAYEGKVDPALVAQDAALWAAIDLGLEALNAGLQFKNALEYITKYTGKTKKEVLEFLKNRLLSRLRKKPAATAEDLASEAIDVAKEATHESESGVLETAPERIEEPLEEAAPKAEEPKSLEESVQSKVVSTAEVPDEAISLKERLQEYETKFINQYAPLDRIGEDGEVFENPGKLAELVDGASGQAKQALELGQFDIETLETTGPGLKQIFEPKRIMEVEGKKKLDRKAFRAYLAARSSLDRTKLGQKTAIPVSEAKAYLEKHKRYEPLAKDYTEFLNRNLTNLRKSGMLTEEVENIMKGMYVGYAPLHRLIEKPKRVPFKRRTLQPEKLPKKAVGSERIIIDPLESAIKNTAATYRAIAKNRVVNAIRNKLEPLGYKVKAAPKADYPKSHIEELMGEGKISNKEADKLSAMKGILDPESYAPGNGKIFGYRDGKRWEMEAPQEILDAVKGLNPAQSSFLIDMVGKWKKVFSSGVVLQPGTMLRISGMDIVVSTLQSKYPNFPVLDLPLNVFYHFPRMLFEAVKKGELYQDYLKSGAAQFALQGLDREGMESMVTNITNSESIIEKGVWDLAKDSLKLPWTALKAAWKGLGMVSEKLGDATRLIEFEKSYRNGMGKGLNRQQALAQAAHDAFEVSVPYGRQGSSAALQEMYKIVPFMRTVVNSNISVAKALDPRNPNFLKMLATALAALTLPTLYFYMRNRNDERYQAIPQEQRDRNIFIYLTDDPNEEPIRLRKLWQYGYIFQTLPEKAMEFLAEKDPKAFESLFHSFEYEFSPFQFLSISSALEDGVQPQKLFEGPTRFKIIPEKQKRIDASLQHTQSTTEIAKKLGALTKISPLYIDFMIGNVGGGLGQNIARLFDEVFYFTGAEEEHRPELKKADNALWGAFFARGPTKQTDHLIRFYKLHDKMQVRKATFKQLQKEGKQKEADKYVIAHPFVNTEPMRRRIGTYYKKIDEVLARPGPTEADRKRKRIELDNLYKDLAREARGFEKSILYDLKHLEKKPKK